MVLGEVMVGDRMAKAAPSLAVVEKRPGTRPTGGCVGIFFQLFDWHRRFAQKKLFSRKLLPPARPKQVTRNFKGDEKMPSAKLHYIADENRAGFPISRQIKNVDVDKKHEMGKPGLVARLMGLESMPSENRRKVEAESSHDKYGDKASKSEVSDKGLGGREDLYLEKEQTRNERPQKLQKTGISESRAVTRFGTEAMQIKGVLSRSRKQNQPKLAPPVKGLGISPVRNASNKSRLIGAASKILEPGLPAKNREKCALTCSRSIPVSSDQVIVECSSVEQTGYVNCGRMLMNSNLSHFADDQELEHSPVSGTSSGSSGFSNAPYLGSDSIKRMSTLPLVKQKVFSKRRQEESISLKDSKRLTVQCQEPWRLPAKKFIPQREDSSVLAALKSRRVSSAESSVSSKKDFVALNRSLSGQTRPRVPNRAERSGSDVTRKSRVRKVDPVSHTRPLGRKTGTASSNHSVGVDFHDSTVGKQRNLTPAAVAVNGKTSDKCSVISFTFNSQMKQEVASPSEVEDGKSSQCGSASECNGLGDQVLEETGPKASLQDQLSIKGDALGAILEQKLKELMAQEEDESTSGSTTPKRSTAIILQELIAALTTDPALSGDFHNLGTDKSFQVKPRKERSLPELSCEANNFSPGSVLEAPFSNDSCVSSSAGDSSGINLLNDYMDLSYDVPQTTGLGSDFFDSETTVEKGRDCGNVTINLIGCINVALRQLSLSGIRLSGSKHSYAKEIILHSQMLFHDTIHRSIFSTDDIIASPSLLDELESHAISSWMSIGWCDGLVDLKEGRQLKEFLFDCLLECLDSKYHPRSNFGYQKWRKLPPCLNEKIMIHDIEIALKTWAGLGGMSVDEMIEWEMGHSLGKWVDFDIEAFEYGCDIESGILQDILNEVVDDFLQLN